MNAHSLLNTLRRPLTIFLFTLFISSAASEKAQRVKKKGGFIDPKNGIEMVSWPTPYGEDIIGENFLLTENLEQTEGDASNRVLKVEKVWIKDCRAVKGSTAHPVDGRVDSRGYGSRGDLAEWPFRKATTAVSYGIIYYKKKSMSDGLHITLADPKGFNVIVVRSREGFKGTLLKNNDRLSSPWNGEKLVDFNGKHQYICRSFNEIVIPKSLSFTEKVDGNTLGDVSFLRIGDSAVKKKYTNGCTYYFASETEIPQSLKFYFDMHFNKDKTVNCCSMLPPEQQNAESLKREPSGYTHFIIPPRQKETALGAVRIHLSFKDYKKGERAIISVQDPLSPKRDLISYPFPINDQGKVNAELDFPDQIVPGNRPLWIRVRTNGAIIKKDIRIVLLMSNQQTALKEYLQYRMTLFKGNYATRSETRPYAKKPVRSHELEKREATIKSDKRGGDILRELYESIDELKRLYPDNVVVKAYHDWIYFREGTWIYPKTLKVIPRKNKEEKNAPDWAVTIKNSIKELLDIATWWLDHRQTHNGEFGGMVNDDTCLLQQFYGASLLSDDETGKRIKQAYHALNELAQKNTIIEGINKTRMDPLHGYEEGINIESTMPLFFYGDPFDFERLMLTARSVKKLTFEKDGARYFKKHYYNASNLTSNDKDLQTIYHTLLLHPVSMIVWYNQNRQAADLVNGVIRGFMAYAKNGQVPQKIDVKNSKPAPKTKYVSLVSYLLRDPLITMMMSDRKSMGYLKGFLSSEEYDKLNDYASLPSAEPIWLKSYKNLNNLIHRMERDYRRNRHFKYIYTDAEIYTDRIFLDQRALLIATLGAFVARNSWCPSIYATYEGFGSNYAPLLLKTGQDRLKIAFYNFNQDELDGNIRVWRLKHGIYKVECGPDADNNGTIDEVKVSTSLELTKYSSIPLKVPPGQTWIIKASLEKELDDIKLRPDLAVSPHDVTYDQSKGDISFFVHNIGSKPSGDFAVSLLAGDDVIQEIQMKSIDFPQDLFPRKRKVSFNNISHDNVRIVLDPENKIKEITKVNNTVILKKQPKLQK